MPRAGVVTGPIRRVATKVHCQGWVHAAVAHRKRNVLSRPGHLHKDWRDFGEDDFAEPEPATPINPRPTAANAAITVTVRERKYFEIPSMVPPLGALCRRDALLNTRLLIRAHHTGRGCPGCLNAGTARSVRRTGCQCSSGETAPSGLLPTLSPRRVTPVDPPVAGAADGACPCRDRRPACEALCNAFVSPAAGCSVTIGSGHSRRAAIQVVLKSCGSRVLAGASGAAAALGLGFVEEGFCVIA